MHLPVDQFGVIIQVCALLPLLGNGRIQRGGILCKRYVKFAKKVPARNDISFLGKKKKKYVCVGGGGDPSVAFVLVPQFPF